MTYTKTSPQQIPSPYPQQSPESQSAFSQASPQAASYSPSNASPQTPPTYSQPSPQTPPNYSQPSPGSLPPPQPQQQARNYSHPSPQQAALSPQQTTAFSHPSPQQTAFPQSQKPDDFQQNNANAAYSVNMFYYESVNSFFLFFSCFFVNSSIIVSSHVRCTLFRLINPLFHLFLFVYTFNLLQLEKLLRRFCINVRFVVCCRGTNKHRHLHSRQWQRRQLRLNVGRTKKPKRKVQLNSDQTLQGSLKVRHHSVLVRTTRCTNHLDNIHRLIQTAFQVVNQGCPPQSIPSNRCTRLGFK